MYCSAMTTRFWVGIFTPAIRAMLAVLQNAIGATPPGRLAGRDIARWVFAKLAVIAGRNAASTGGNAILLRRFGRLGSVKSGAGGLNTRGVLDRPLAERGDRDQEVTAEVG